MRRLLAGGLVLLLPWVSFVSAGEEDKDDRLQSYLVVKITGMGEAPSYQGLTREEHAELVKRYRLESVYFRRAQKAASEAWAGPGRYPGRVFTPRRIYILLRVSDKADAEKRANMLAAANEDKHKQGRGTKKTSGEKDADLDAARELLEEKLAQFVEEAEKQRSDAAEK